jgi:hypothetical protein
LGIDPAPDLGPEARYQRCLYRESVGACVESVQYLLGMLLCCGRRNETMMARKDRTVAERPKAMATAASVDMAYGH